MLCVYLAHGALSAWPTGPAALLATATSAASESLSTCIEAIAAQSDPAKLAPLIAGNAEHEIQAALHAEVVSILTELSNPQRAVYTPPLIPVPSPV